MALLTTIRNYGQLLFRKLSLKLKLGKIIKVLTLLCLFVVWLFFSGLQPVKVRRHFHRNVFLQTVHNIAPVSWYSHPHWWSSWSSSSLKICQLNKLKAFKTIFYKFGWYDVISQPPRVENQKLRDKLQKLQEKSGDTMTGNNKDELSSLGEEKIKNDKEIKEKPVTEKKERSLELTQEQVKR